MLVWTGKIRYSVSMPQLTAAHVKKELARHATPKKAKASAWFFKTGKGQYGEGDKFIGVTVPEQRRVAKQFSDLPLAQVMLLLRSRVHEHRLTALLILVRQFQRGSDDEQKKIYNLYMKNTRYINNWDLVDSSASYIAGVFLLRQPAARRKMLYTFARSKDLWKKRIAIIATQAFIRVDQYDDTLKIAELLLNDTHDLIHKAVGWMLREVGNRNQAVEEAFLRKHAAHMPRTMLRYAIEKFSTTKRERYLKMKLT